MLILAEDYGGKGNKPAISRALSGSTSRPKGGGATSRPASRSSMAQQVTAQRVAVPQQGLSLMAHRHSNNSASASRPHPSPQQSSPPAASSQHPPHPPAPTQPSKPSAQLPSHQAHPYQESLSGRPVSSATTTSACSNDSLNSEPASSVTSSSQSQESIPSRPSPTHSSRTSPATSPALSGPQQQPALSPSQPAPPSPTHSPISLTLHPPPSPPRPALLSSSLASPAFNPFQSPLQPASPVLLPPQSPEPQPSQSERQGSGLSLMESGSLGVGEPDTDITPQAMDVLAALAGMGISPQVRERVQDALQQLKAASTAAAACLPEGKALGKGTAPAGKEPQPGHSKANSGAISKKQQQQVESLEHKLAVSRSIMRKLYYRNVSLEKELQVVQANASPIKFNTNTTELLRCLGSERPSTAAAGSNPGAVGGDSTRVLVAQALQERDATVMQLQQALDASRRRCALLEGGLAASGQAEVMALSAGKPGRGGKAAAGALAAESLQHQTKYRQMRDDYYRLLNKRAGALAMGKAASAAARGILGEMQLRLRKEVAEREAEAAAYSAQLYETEQQISDGYVEKRMMEEHCARLSEELAQRDVLDREIESTVCGLFERLKQVEAENLKLRTQNP